MFGSNGEETADYSRGVLERFTHRAENRVGTEIHCKIVANPRTINFMDSPHHALKFEGIITIDEQKKPRDHQWTIDRALSEKIVVNHYHCKSREEYAEKVSRGSSAHVFNHKRMENFDSHDCNEEFDDGILKYRDERAKNYQPPDNSHINERLLTALMTNLLPTLQSTTSQDFYRGKMETFLTCRAVCDYLKAKLIDDAPAKFFEEASLVAALKSVAGMSLAEARLLIRELPNLLSLPYPVVKDLRGVCLQIIPQLMEIMHLNGIWRDYAELDYIRDLLKLESDKL